MSYDVFISYGSHDRKVADHLCQYLETDCGLSCWIAPRNILSGNYAGEITRALKSSSCVLVVCSQESSRSEHVKNEVTLAFNQQKLILPYCLDESPFDDDLEYYLASKQQIHTSGNQRKDFELIGQILKNRFGTESEQKKAKKDFPLRLLLILIGCAIILSGGYFLIKALGGWTTISQEAGSPATVEDTFTGKVLNGYPDGFGTYTFSQRRRIDMHDSEVRMGEKGDYISGNWTNGHLNYGEWFDAKGRKKGFIQLGDYPDTETDHPLGKCAGR